MALGDQMSTSGNELRKEDSERDYEMNIRELEAKNIIEKQDERLKKLIVWTCGTLDELVEHKLITGPKMLTRKGKTSFNKIKDSFSPTKEEILMGLYYITEGKLGVNNSESDTSGPN